MSTINTYVGIQQQKIITNHNQIIIWHNEHKPTDWIAKQLHVSRELLKKNYPTYAGNQGGKGIKGLFAKKEYEQNPNTCLFCKATLSYNKRNNTFCNCSCAHQYEIIITKNQTKQLKCSYCSNFITVYIKVGKVTCKNCKRQHNKFYYSKIYVRKKNFTNICIICSNPFKAFNNKVKTCSDKCKSKLLSNNSKQNPNCGGETNYHRYRYNNILMDSSWEVEIAKWFDLNNIKWIRSKKLVLYWFDSNNEKRRYHPDFYLPDYDIYVDPKNDYKQKLDADKINRVLENNKVKLFIGNVEQLQNNIKSFIRRCVSGKTDAL